MKKWRRSESGGREEGSSAYKFAGQKVKKVACWWARVEEWHVERGCV